MSKSCEWCQAPFISVQSKKSSKFPRFCSRSCIVSHRNHVSPMPKASLESLFWRYVNRSTGCWIWTGSTNKYGYGVISRHGKAHRASWKIHNGEFDTSLCVCHKCDNPLCVNPDHLFLGTKKDNSEDMVRKGRSTATRNGRAKLTVNEVLEIRSRRTAGAANHELAVEYGVSAGLISKIMHRKAWASVP